MRSIDGDYLEPCPPSTSPGRAVQLAQGVVGSERACTATPSPPPPCGGRRRAPVAAPGRPRRGFGRGSNRELQAEIVGALDILVEMSGGIRDDDSLSAALRPGAARSTSARPPRAGRVVRADHRRARRPRRDHSTCCGPHTFAARLDPGWVATSTRRWARLDSEGCARRRDRRQQGQDAPGSEPAAAARRLRRHPGSGRRVGRVTTLDDIRAPMALVPDGVGARSPATAPSTRGGSPSRTRSLSRRGHRAPRRPRDPVPRRRRWPGGQGVNFVDLRDAGDPVELARTL